MRFINHAPSHSFTSKAVTEHTTVELDHTLVGGGRRDVVKRYGASTGVGGWLLIDEKMR